MGASFDNDVFVSYPREQRSTVEGIVNEIRAAGLSVWWDKDISPGDAWRERLEEKIRNSRHFLLYCNVQAKASEMVTHEVATFRTEAKGDPSRRLFVLRAPDCEPKHVLSDLGDVQHVSTLADVIIYALRQARDEMSQRLHEAIQHADTKVAELNENLQRERAKVADARKYYRHSRFWGPFAENRDVHIFTCGRDIPPDDARPRGTGGFRTNIDKWDYRAVLAIAHYFALNFPGTRLTIEDPASKLQQEDIGKTHVLANRIAEIGNLLEDKDCIIIGSPDVNDFAEVVLGRIHGIHPYDNDRKKSKGFVLVRDRKHTASSFYWQTSAGEQEGIARLGRSEISIYPHEPTTSGTPTGTMHGILIVGENPFGSSTPRRRIMILSGFSGVATHGLAKFLTEETYLHSFFEFDEAQAEQTKAVEALVAVRYFVESGSENKDARQIEAVPDSISFKELVAV
jgi:TIR domain